MDVTALKNAARAAIVMPAVFAFADNVIEQPQTSLFAAFGSFAILVLVEFEGTWRTRLAAYLALALVGAVYITLGTLCSRNAWLAAGSMAVVGFVTLFSGAISGYAAAGSSAALLTFVLPVTVAAPASAIPDRLDGWALASGAGICAHLLLWPPRRHADVRRRAAGALRAVADLLDAGRDAIAERARLARGAVDDLGRRVLGTQNRPSGPTAATAALASLPEELDWLLSFVAPTAELPPLEPAGPEEREAMAAAASVLGTSASTLDGRHERPDFARLDAAREAVAQALVRRLPELPVDARSIPDELEPPFRIRAATFSARQAAIYALRAAETDQAPSTAASLDATQQVAIEHASVRSVWFRNSIRGAAGLALAVFVAQRTGVQHGFWVVLGTLSVLRSNALGTGWSIVSALVGTGVGLVVGSLLVIGIGTHQVVLWLVLPFAVLLAAYAPRAISFAAGQAGFTVMLFVLFNLIVPVGWRVGLVRVEDVAIGFAISLAVGVLFWPRGAAALLRENLAAAYARSADYVVASARQLIEGAGSQDADRAARTADAALDRLDEAFREYLAERSAADFHVEDIGALVGGATRVRRAGFSLAELGRMAGDAARLEHCGENLGPELAALRSWYVALGDALVEREPVPAPHDHDTDGEAQLLACVRQAARSRNPQTVTAGLVLLWASQHLDNLCRLEGRLAEHARAAHMA
ncbi:MAG TPA: FUSC family protein [Gaiellaceae bacterium]|nr:FUSC family protein [Gaiellaceae bacterium]